MSSTEHLIPWHAPESIVAAIREQVELLKKENVMTNRPFFTNERSGEREIQPRTMAPHEQVLASLLEFYKAREWEQFHSPKNLVMDLASEAGELLDLFRWMSEEQSYHPDPETLQAIRDEIADVFKAVLYIAHKFDIDLIEAAYQKFEKMKQKYPAEKCRGKALKYTAYDAS